MPLVGVKAAIVYSVESGEGLAEKTAFEQSAEREVKGESHM